MMMLAMVLGLLGRAARIVPRLPAPGKARLTAVAALSLGCAGQASEPQRPAGTSSKPAHSVSGATSAAAASAGVTPAAAPEPTLLITDRAVLRALEDAGLTLGAVLGS